MKKEVPNKINIPDSKYQLFGYIASLAAAASYGVSANLAKAIVNDIAAPLIATSFALLFGFLILTTIYHKHLINIKNINKKTFIFLFLAGMAGSTGVGSQYYAMNNAPVFVVAPITGSYPLFAIFFSFLFLRKVEKQNLSTLIGAVMIILGVTLIILSK
tara:strand:- start:2205 stop:2681 length:477 start_codon:yes stop_codon:yes gene_type:complete